VAEVHNTIFSDAINLFWSVSGVAAAAATAAVIQQLRDSGRFSDTRFAREPPLN
jgi:hypothetical protein